MANYFWVGGSGTWDNASSANWSLTTGGAGGAGVPLAADNVTFDANSGAGTCAIGTGAIARTLACSAYIGTFAFGSNEIRLAGSSATVFSGGAGYSVTGTPNLRLTYIGSTGTRTVAGSASGLESNVFNIIVPSGADIIATGTNRRYGSFDFTGFSGSLTNTTRTLFGSLTISSGMTLTAGANATTFAATSGTKTITTNGKTVDFPLTFDGSGGTFAFADALTQGSTRAFTITNGTVQLKAGVTSTVGAFTTSGTNQKFLQSTLAGSQATISQAGGTVNSIYLTIKDINATGGATWNAYTTNSNVDAGNNLGWDFSFQLGRTIYTRRKNKRILP
jgi:hypothetical protein